MDDDNIVPSNDEPTGLKLTDELKEEFEGVFYFTNATEEEFVQLWNNVEYRFPAHTRCPLIIRSEPLENIQEIRKRFAYKLAVREFYKSKEYIKMSKMGNGLPPTFDEKILQPWIDQCLNPLPKAKAKITPKPKDKDTNYKATKAVSEKDNLPYEFRDDEAVALGKQPETEI